MISSSLIIPISSLITIILQYVWYCISLALHRGHRITRIKKPLWWWLKGRSQTHTLSSCGQYRYKITNKCIEEVVGFIDAFYIYPNNISASQCHHQGFVVTSEATQAISVLWMYMDCDPSSVVGCWGM
jgi:hypothetical protein